MAPRRPTKSTSDSKNKQKKVFDDVIKKPKKIRIKKDYSSFSRYLFILLRSLEIGKHLGITKHCMLIMNHFVNDMLQKIAAEAERLVCFRRTRTLGSMEVSTALRLLLPGELAVHANITGMKALSRYKNRQLGKAKQRK